MLLFALALHGATSAAEPQRRRKPRVTRVTRIPASAAPKPRTILVATPTDPGQRYRLPLASTEIKDGKSDAVRDPGMACGTTGAPVCPHNGMTILKSE